MRYSTPLRYPGGKHRLTPFVLEILRANDLLGCDYVEPYAGGAGVAIQLLLDGHVNNIHLNDSSKAIYSFWRSILTRTDEFCRLVSTASLTVEEWKRQREVIRNPDKNSLLDLGFSTFFLNRCNRSGVLSGGLIGGLQQNGAWKMDARFSRNELIRRIEVIAARRDSIAVQNLDAEQFMADCIPNLPDKSFVYCDPPYFNKAQRLYLDSYQAKDHERIASVIQKKLPRSWIVSYDDAPEILEYYAKRRSFLYSLQYNAATVYKGREVFVFSDDLVLPLRSKLPCIDEVVKCLDQDKYRPDATSHEATRKRLLAG